MKYYSKYLENIIKNFHSIYIDSYFHFVQNILIIYNPFKLLSTIFRPLFGQTGITNIINGVFVKLLLLVFYIPLILFFLTFVTFLYFGLFILAIIFVIDLNLLAVILLLFFGLLLTYLLYQYSNFLKINHSNYSMENIYLSAKSDLRNILDAGSYELKDLLEYLVKSKVVRKYLRILEIDHEEVNISISKNLAEISKEKYENELINVIRDFKVDNIEELTMFYAFLKTINYNIKTDLEKNIDPNDFNLVYKIISEKKEFSIQKTILLFAARLEKELDQPFSSSLKKYSNNLSEEFRKRSIKVHYNINLEKEELFIDQLMNNKKSVLLVGEVGTGRDSFITSLVRKIDQDIFKLDINKLIESANPVTSLQSIINDVIMLNGILYINNAHRLKTDLHQSSKDVLINIIASTLANKRINLVMVTDKQNYNKYFKDDIELLKSITLHQFSEPQGDVLEKINLKHFLSLNKYSKTNSTISLYAIRESISISNRYNSRENQPQKSINLIKTALNQTDYVTASKIKKIASTKYQMPINVLTDKERDTYLSLENEIKKYIIGQEHAITEVATSLRRARVGVRDDNKPIASFMFAGPTGVGKTEMVKTINKIIFSDKKFLRLDMSEYKNVNSLDRLIGANNRRGTLTDFVDNNPYSLILIDEIDKAHPDVLDIFLQVLDDSILTNVDSQTTDFSNTLIVMTTNIGTKAIIANEGLEKEETEQLAIDELKKYFKIEFLNRFTSLIVFDSLSQQEILEITKLKLNNITNKFKERNIDIVFTDKYINNIAIEAYSPVWGARNIDRVIEKEVENTIADKLLRKELSSGSKIEL